MWKAEVVADSINQRGDRLTTIECVYPRLIHAEVLRHRMFSHAVQSSRAVPVARMIEHVRTNPYVPHFAAEQSGMAAGADLSAEAQAASRRAWRIGAMMAVHTTQELRKQGVHKQWANRPLETYQWIAHVITATEWANFMVQRLSAGAQPEARTLATMIKCALGGSTPVERRAGEWHLPYVSDAERAQHGADAVGLSIGRAARISYERHHLEEPAERSIARASKMKAMGHMGPFEHAAQAASDSAIQRVLETHVTLRGADGETREAWISGSPDEYGETITHEGETFEIVEELGSRAMFANFSGWIQARKFIRREWCHGGDV